MKTLEISTRNLFWRFYCLNFTLQGKPLSEPTNLCNFFWTSLNGVCLSVAHVVNKAKLSYLWLSIVVMFCVAQNIPASVADQPIACYTIVSLISLIVIPTLILSAVRIEAKISKIRFVAWMKRILDITCVIAVISGVSVISIAKYRDNTLWSDMLKPWFSLVGILFALAVVTILVTQIFKWYFNPTKTKRLETSVEIVITFLKAQKAKVCPLIKVKDD